MQTENPQPKERSFWGRLVVLGSFWGVAAWAGLAVIGSLVVTLYGRPPAVSSSDELAHTRQRAWCVRTLVGLRDELEGEVNHELTHPAQAGPPLARFQQWSEDWQNRFEEAAALCHAGFEPAMADAYAKLRGLHQGHLDALTLMARTRTDIGRPLNETVHELTTSLPHPSR